MLRGRGRIAGYGAVFGTVNRRGFNLTCPPFFVFQEPMVSIET